MDDDKTSLKEVVAAYLRKHPDFLDQFPDILEELHLNHSSGVAASLIERQVEQLRQKNQELDRQLNRLIHVASENEDLMSRLHQLTLDLLIIDSRKEFFTQLGNREAGEDVTHIQADDPAMEQFRVHLDKDHTMCGRLNESKLEFLFGTKARWVQSTALVPLGEKGADGMMAIGSSDPARFYPGMGTLFLDLLANLISSSLTSPEQQEQRRSA